MGGTQRGTALQHSVASQRQALKKGRVLLIISSLIDSAELMRKTQENIYYKLLLNEIDLN